MTQEHPIDELDVPLTRDPFLRTLLRHLSGALEDVVGTDEAAGFISLVGQEMGHEIGAMYRRALAVPRRQSAASAVADQPLRALAVARGSRRSWA